MSNFTVPYTFVGGTKAKAEEVNANFSAIKDELNVKAEITDSGSVVVGTATESNHAVNKGQAESMISTALLASANCNLSNLSEEGNQKFYHVPYSVHSGNKNSNGEADILQIDSGSSANKVYFKIGNNLSNQYPNLVCISADGTKFERSSIDTLNCSSLANGTYNLFVGETGACVPLANTIYRQKNQPPAQIESAWSQPTLSANGTLGGDSFAIYSTVRTSSSDNNLAYTFFDGVTTQSTGMQITNSSGYLIFYNPVPLKVLNLTINSRASYVISKYTLSGSNDNSNWTQIGSYSGNTNITWSQVINNDNSYKYYKIDLSGNSNNVLIEVGITATEFISGASVNDVWLDISIKPYKSYKFDGSDWEEFDYIPLPQSITMQNRVITAINKSGNFDGNGWEEFLMLPDTSKETSLSNGVEYKASVNGWISSSSALIKPLLIGETFAPTSSDYKFYAMKGV